jgi:hypothetical protein
MKSSFGKGVLPVGIVLLVVTILASAVAWWRWERIPVIGGTIPLPPGSELIKKDEPENQRMDIMNLTCSIPRKPSVVSGFYLDRLTEAGYQCEQNEENIFTFTTSKRIFRLVLHPEKRRTIYTINYRMKK